MRGQVGRIEPRVAASARVGSVFQSYYRALTLVVQPIALVHSLSSSNHTRALTLVVQPITFVHTFSSSNLIRALILVVQSHSCTHSPRRTRRLNVVVYTCSTRFRRWWWVRQFVHRVPGTHAVLYSVETLVVREAFETDE